MIKYGCAAFMPWCVDSVLGLSFGHFLVVKAQINFTLIQGIHFIVPTIYGNDSCVLFSDLVKLIKVYRHVGSDIWFGFDPAQVFIVFQVTCSRQDLIWGWLGMQVDQYGGSRFQKKKKEFHLQAWLQPFWSGSGQVFHFNQ
jgi:hypothetical protein